jgi:ubiquinone/menaquinone biosynthesis C-methylase UbiE
MIILQSLLSRFNSKEEAEASFWKSEMDKLLDWYRGNRNLWSVAPPLEAQKVKSYDEKTSAILTFFELHQKVKYLEDLQLDESSFSGEKLLDIGSGPYPSALAFAASQVFCLDPLLPTYMRIGYPIHLYEPRARFVFGHSENMPFESEFFDSVVSVNAIDHVDDFEKTALEIRRVLKPGGKFRMHVHYHKPTTTEPLEINDFRFEQAFSWVTGLKKISESHQKTGFTIESEDENYVVWSNF